MKLNPGNAINSINMFIILSFGGTKATKKLPGSITSFGMTFLIIKGQDKIISVLPLCIFLSVLKYARIEYFNCSVIRYPAEIFINDLRKNKPHPMRFLFSVPDLTQRIIIGMFMCADKT